MKFRPFILILLIMACEPNEEVYFGEQQVEGYMPVYSNGPEDLEIKLMEAQPIERAGKLYLYGNLLLINEISKGIHIIDNTDPANPIKLGFIQVPGSSDIVIKENVIYSNNFLDLVALKITPENTVEIVERIEGVISHEGLVNDLYPPEQGFYFECVDPAKGKILLWQKTLLTNPKCYR